MRRLLSLLVRLVSRRRVRRPAKPAPRAVRDDRTPPPAYKLVNVEGKCPGCGVWFPVWFAHACPGDAWGGWRGME